MDTLHITPMDIALKLSYLEFTRMVTGNTPKENVINSLTSDLDNLLEVIVRLPSKRLNAARQHISLAIKFLKQSLHHERATNQLEMCISKSIEVVDVVPTKNIKVDCIEWALVSEILRHFNLSTTTEYHKKYFEDLKLVCDHLLEQLNTLKETTEYLEVEMGKKYQLSFSPNKRVTFLSRVFSINIQMISFIAYLGGQLTKGVIQKNTSTNNSTYNSLMNVNADNIPDTLIPPHSKPGASESSQLPHISLDQSPIIRNMFEVLTNHKERWCNFCTKEIMKLLHVCKQTGHPLPIYNILCYIVNHLEESQTATMTPFLKTELFSAWTEIIENYTVTRKSGVEAVKKITELLGLVVGDFTTEENDEMKRVVNKLVQLYIKTKDVLLYEIVQDIAVITGYKEFHWLAPKKDYFLHS